MKKILLLTLLCVLVFCSLCTVTAAADQYPGVESGVSYWVLLTENDGYGPADNNGSIARFSIAGTMGFEPLNKEFTSDTGKYVTAVTDGATAVKTFYCTDSVLEYADGGDIGYRFIQNSSGKYYICTSDGIYIKRTGGFTSLNKPGISYTDQQSSATAFTVELGDGGYRIYDSGTGGYAALKYDSSANCLTMKQHSKKGDIQAIPLYRRGYDPSCYLRGRFVVNGQGGIQDVGPFRMNNSGVQSNPRETVTISCYYREADQNARYFDRDVEILPLAAGVNIPDDSVVYDSANGLLTWQIDLPDAPEGHGSQTFQVNVNVQTHSWGDTTYTLSADGSGMIEAHACVNCGHEVGIAEINMGGSGSAGEPWPIGSAARWDLFGAAIADGLDTSGKYFELTDNITVTTMIGTAENPFAGVFDGAGHTLTVNYTATETFCAPFRYVDGAAIENLTVTGTITTNYISAAGFVGNAANSCAITNCVSDVNIISNVTSANEHGGFVATAANTRVEGCVYTGSITGNNPRYCAGFINRGDNGCLCVNCIFAPDSFPTNNCANFCRWGSAGANCYYFTFLDSGRESGKQAYSVQGGNGVTLDFGTPAAQFPTSGITAYDTGLVYNNVFYAGAGESILFDVIDNTSVLETLEGVRSDQVTLQSTGTDTGWQIGAMPAADVYIQATVVSGVQYIGPGGSTTAYEFTVVTGGTGATWPEGVYAVSGSVTMPWRVTVSGTVTLILTDGSHLSLPEGIAVNSGAGLILCAQSTGDAMGSLEAIGTPGCAGIGGDSEQNCGSINICGGRVTAQGGDGGGAAIGGGCFGDGGSITIGGNAVIVKAMGGYGSYEAGNSVSSSGYILSSSEGSDEFVHGKPGGFGGGYPDDKIGNDSSVPVGPTFVSSGAGIGGGASASGGSITIGGNAVLQEVNGGSCNDCSGGAGIGGGGGGSGGTINITGGTIQSVMGGVNAAGIGGGASGSGGTISITGGSVTAYGDPYYEKEAGGGAGIGGGRQGSGGTIVIGGSATVTAYGARFAAGIGGGAYGDGGSITVNGGTVKADGMHPIPTTYGAGTFGAGIGSGFYGSGGCITINGGTVNADGGLEGAFGNGGIKGGAGIGCGYHGEDAQVIIHGGSVEAMGGLYAAGIGGTNSASYGTILIDGGNVKATGRAFGAGIGTGYSDSEGIITIAGGTVNAKGGACGAGIGGGCKSSGGTINITGGTVSAEAGQVWSMYFGAAGIGAGGEEKRFNGRGCGTITISGGTIVKAQGAEPDFTTSGYIDPADIGDGGNDGNIAHGTVILDWVPAADGSVPGEPCICPADFNCGVSLAKAFGDQQNTETRFRGGLYGNPALDELTLVPCGPDYLISVVANGGTVQPVVRIGEETLTADRAFENETVTLELIPNGDNAPVALTMDCGGVLTQLSFEPGPSGYSEASFTMPPSEVIITAFFHFGPASFTMPEQLTTIEDSAFEGNTLITAVDAHSVTHVGANAFRGCTGLTQIRLDGACQIDETAFADCGTVYIFAPGGGDTEDWCRGRTGIVFVEEAEN